jgi:hypothetical protein
MCIDGLPDCIPHVDIVKIGFISGWDQTHVPVWVFIAALIP